MAEGTQVNTKYVWMRNLLWPMILCLQSLSFICQPSTYLSCGLNILHNSIHHFFIIWNIRPVWELWCFRHKMISKRFSVGIDYVNGEVIGYSADGVYHFQQIINSGLAVHLALTSKHCRHLEWEVSGNQSTRLLCGWKMSTHGFDVDTSLYVKNRSLPSLMLNCTQSTDFTRHGLGPYQT